MKKLLFMSILMGMPITALSQTWQDYAWTMCENCCYLPDDKARYVNWTYNKMFVEEGSIKAQVDFNSSLLHGNGDATLVKTVGTNTLPRSGKRADMDFENTPEWDLSIEFVGPVPVPIYTFSHWNVQSFDPSTLHNEKVTPATVKFRKRAGGWAVDPVRLPYPPNCAVDENKGSSVEWWTVTRCLGTPNRAASIEIAVSFGAVSYRYAHEPLGVCWAVAAIGGI
jgi:hypothetical protein